MTTCRAFSYGGGVQSNAVLVLQGEGRLPEPYDFFMFSNVGHDSENPATLDYIETYARPYAREHNIPFYEVQKLRGRGKNKTPDTLLTQIYRQQKSFVIPIRMGQNGAPGNRNCTENYKIQVVANAIKAMEYNSATIGLGISTDEFSRARSQEWYAEDGIMKRREYPLIDLRMDRQACYTLLEAVGMGKPPKSSCWFCPFHKRSEWIEMKRNEPELFAKAIAVEQEINRKRLAIGRDQAYLHPDLVPLERAVGDQLPMFPENDDPCDSGYCMV